MMKLVDRIIGVALMAVAVYGYLYSKSLKGDAGTLPGFIFITLFLGAFALLFFSFGKKQSEAVEKMCWKKWFVAVGGALAYMMLLNILGFYLASAIYLAATMFYFGVRGVRTLVMVPAIFDAVIFVCFSLVLGIRLPVPFFM